ncbi:MAG: FtsX-like permease family protein [Demequina sp.]|uniref:FtsX-like permease family protein n=1 Tax=Demequina sp. TaxID=2050685 RepID=UPI003A857400
MIATLVREQVRSQRATLVWTFALLVIAASLAATALVAASTQAALDASPTYGAPAGMDRAAAVTEWSRGLPADSATNDSVAAQPGSIQAAVDTAHTAGYAAYATQIFVLEWEPVADDHDALVPYMGDASASYVDSSAAIREGRAPLPGEIAIASDVAAELGLTIGSRVEAHAVVGSEVGPNSTMTLTVTGIAVAATAEPFQSSAVDAYVAWEDGVTLTAAAFDQPAVGGGTTSPLNATVEWQDGAPGMDAFRGEPTAQLILFDPRDSFRIPLEGWSGTLWIAALFASAGAVVAGVVIGTAQSRERVRWLTTAKVLGATERTSRLVTACEALLLGIASAVIGLGIGWLVNAGVLAWQRTEQPDAALPAMPIVLPVAAWVVLIVALVVSVITSFAPHVVASRLTPAAALASRAAEAPRSHKGAPLRGRHLGATTAGGVALVVLGSAVADYWGPWIAGAGVVVVAVAGVAGLQAIALGALARRAMRLGARSEPWAIATGHAILARPRQHASAALVYALAGAVLTGTLGHGVYALASSGGETGATAASFGDLFEVNYGREWPSWGALAVITTFLLLSAFIAGLVIVATRASVSEDEAIHAALGLAHGDRRRAVAAETALPLTVGAILGPIAGWSFLAIVSMPQAASLGAWTAAALLTAPGAAVIVATGVVVAGTIAALASLTARPAPAQQSR